MNKKPRKEPSNSINHDRQFTGVQRQFIQGQEKGNGIYEEESNIPDCEFRCTSCDEFSSYVFEMFNEDNAIEELDVDF
ncbi:10903_t:CDS:2 [Entrophospora sp. SA101]|nr:10903_t:CDS:2 [Entrophospora sp. SA101]